MDVLCTDKTGTLTEAKIALAGHPRHPTAPRCARVRRLRAVAASFGGGIRSPLDARASSPARRRHAARLDARSTSMPSTSSAAASRCSPSTTASALLIVKGAPEAVLALCSAVERGDGGSASLDGRRRPRRAASATCTTLAAQGLRLLAIAWKACRPATRSRDRGRRARARLRRLLRVRRSAEAERGGGHRPACRRRRAASRSSPATTGRSSAACRTASDDAGARHADRREIAALSDDALARSASRSVDAVRPRLARPEDRGSSARCRPRGHIVGFIGDGINDAPAIHAADVGLSVDGATDVAPRRRRHDPAGARSGRARRRRRGGPAHLRQHPQICAHGHELQFRQHAVDGARLDGPAVPADVADADPAQQSALRSLGNRHPLRHRRRRRHLARPQALGHAGPDPALHR